MSATRKLKNDKLWIVLLYFILDSLGGIGISDYYLDSSMISNQIKHEMELKNTEKKGML